MQKLIYVAIISLSFSMATAQTLVKGKVIDANNLPVAGASVLILTQSDSSLVKGQATNAAGMYEISNINPGTYLLQVEMIGHESFYKKLFITTGQNIAEQETVQLSALSTALKDVVVTSRRRTFESQVDRTVFNVQNSPATAALTALDVLSRSPNIDIDRLNNQIAMNGKQGVVVMLNGKMMRMESAALIQYLSGMSAANIKKIEFIHTPPASMDAAGNAGVINFELIKKEDEGLNGSWSANAGYGSRGKFGSAVNLNYRKGRVNLYSDFSFNNNYTESDVTNNITSVSGGIATNTNLFSRRPPFAGLYNGRIGLDYEWSKKTTVGFLISGYISDWKLDARTNTTISNDTGYYNLSRLKSLETNNWKHLMGNINFQHQLSNQSKLTADIDYLYYIDNNPTRYEDERFNRNGELAERTAFNSGKRTPIDFFVASLDYTSQLNQKLKLQAGLKTTQSSFSNDLNVTRLVNSKWEIDPVFTGIQKLEEDIQAVYASADYQFNSKIFLRAGLRYEKTYSNLTNQENKSLVKLNYGRLFPVISFSQKFSNDRQWQVSYNERITRPPFNTIAPAFFFFGPNSIVGGNPSVRPTISRQFTSSYQQKNLLFTLQLNVEDKPIRWQPFSDTINNFVMLRSENLKRLSTAMFSVNYTAKIKWWSSQYNIAFYGQETRPVVDDVVLNRKDFYISFNTTQTFKLPKNLTVELSNQTITARNYGLGKSPFITAVNLGVQKSIGTKNKLALSWTDIFDTGSFLDIRYNQPQLNVKYDFLYQVEGSVLSLSFVHRFGNDKVKKAARRQSSEEEQKRLN